MSGVAAGAAPRPLTDRIAPLVRDAPCFHILRAVGRVLMCMNVRKKAQQQPTAAATPRHVARGGAASTQETQRRPRTMGALGVKPSKQVAKPSKQDLYDMLRQAVENT
jgi:hypothetical protein